MNKEKKEFLKNYRVEIIAASFVAIGVFLLVEQFSIRATLLRFFRNFVVMPLKFVRFIVDYVSSFTLSDLLGWILIFIAIILIVLRIRWRYIHSPAFLDQNCPKCGTSTYRTHRKPMDRIISKIFLFRAGRYKCKNTMCKWSGLKNKH